MKGYNPKGLGLWRGEIRTFHTGETEGKGVVPIATKGCESYGKRGEKKGSASINKGARQNLQQVYTSGLLREGGLKPKLTGRKEKTKSKEDRTHLRVKGGHFINKIKKRQRRTVIITENVRDLEIMVENIIIWGAVVMGPKSTLYFINLGECD